MAETTNYGLYITETADNPSFEDWRNALCGSDDSNMQKIDAALANAAPQHFIVTITGDETNGYTADKTVDEIVSAFNSGSLVLATHNGLTYQMLFASSSSYCFYCINMGWVKQFHYRVDAPKFEQYKIKTPVTGNPGDFVIIGEDGNLTTITIPLAEDGVV